MSFESRVQSFSERFLSRRSFELIVEPALADLEFESAEGRQAASRLAVVRALAGAVQDDFKSQLGIIALLWLVPTGYYFVLMTVCFDFFAGETGKRSMEAPLALAVPLLLLSLSPVLVCFWPEGRVTRPTE